MVDVSKLSAIRVNVAIMDILKAEIAKKRKHIEEKELLDDSTRYFKRADLVRKEQEDYYKRCGYEPEKREEMTEPATSSNPVLELELTEEKLPMTLSRQEVIRRLRERGEPIRLFGESDYDAFQRLRKIEILAPEVNKGLRNDLKAAMDKIDQQYLNEIVGGQESGEMDMQHDLKVHEENTTIEELEALGESLGTGDDNGDMDVINKVLKFLLGVWAKELNGREEQVKRSVQGKLASATHNQTESYLKPLFRKLRKKVSVLLMPAGGSIVLRLHKMTNDYAVWIERRPLFTLPLPVFSLSSLCFRVFQQTSRSPSQTSLSSCCRGSMSRFAEHLQLMSPHILRCCCVSFVSEVSPWARQANDAYLQMAIGNAPWPIGVTMVGIHARTGREKIFSKHVAHVLNDETQRKYIQVRAGAHRSPWLVWSI
uniref:Pre-mRNA-splicing factor 18 n=1 Tax=Paramormyrops kingsleyae TaxID=1676925 RepID=A0A3B3SXF2_9TELE